MAGQSGLTTEGKPSTPYIGARSNGQAVIATWEQRKLGEVAKRVSLVCDDPHLPRVEFADINPGEGTLNKPMEKLGRAKQGILFEAGDTLYGKLRPYLHNWLYAQFVGVALGDFWVLRPTGIDKGYLYRLVQGERFDAVANISSGSKMPRADWRLVSSSNFYMPQDRSEQKAIAVFFEQFDHLITLHQREGVALFSKYVKYTV